jgi:hypothetical protein
VIERIDDLPEGVIGLRFSGAISRADYDRAVLPLLEEALRGDEQIRMVVVIDDGFEKFELGALWEDTKFGAKGIAHHSKWERMALVSDADWVRHAISLLGWIVPGDVKVFPLAEQATAVAWAATG